jgi:plastocyanin
MNIKTWLAVAILAAGSVGLAIGDDAATKGTGAAIRISAKDFMFSPATVTVKAGSTVTWTNLDEEPHTVFSDAGLFRSSALDTKDSFSYKFDEPGTYHYLCTIHPRMVGTIVVQ